MNPHAVSERSSTVKCGGFGGERSRIGQVCRKIEQFLVAWFFSDIEGFIGFDLVGQNIGRPSIPILVFMRDETGDDLADDMLDFQLEIHLASSRWHQMIHIFIWKII